MSFSTDLKASATAIFTEGNWKFRDGQVVPEPESLTLGKDGIKLDATILYSDLVGSTAMVGEYTDWFSAEVYKAFLHCSAKLIENDGGTVAAYDGDRIMGIFIGDDKENRATHAAMMIHGAEQKILNPAISKTYYEGQSGFQINHVTGVACSPILVARTGIRGANDLVWVGNAANHAAKLCNVRDGFYKTYITSDVFQKLSQENWYSKSGEMMWASHTVNGFSEKVYGTHWYWYYEVWETE